MLLKNNINRILVLAPHTDDGEFGCGASIAKFVEKNIEVYYVAFSTAEESVPPGFPKDILKTEVKEATKILKIKTNNLILNLKGSGVLYLDTIGVLISNFLYHLY